MTTKKNKQPATTKLRILILTTILYTFLHTPCLAVTVKAVSYRDHKSIFETEHRLFEIQITGIETPRLCEDGMIEIDIPKIENLQKANPTVAWKYKPCDDPNSDTIPCQTNHALWPLKTTLTELANKHFDFFSLSHIFETQKQDLLIQINNLPASKGSQDSLLNNLADIEHLADIMRPSSYQKQYYSCITSISDALSNDTHSAIIKEEAIADHAHILRLKVLQLICDPNYKDLFDTKEVFKQLNNWIYYVRNAYRPNGAKFADKTIDIESEHSRFFRDSTTDIKLKLIKELELVRLILTSENISKYMDESFEKLYTSKESNLKTKARGEINRLKTANIYQINFSCISDYISRAHNYTKKTKL